MRLLPARFVDVLPQRWWRQGNVHMTAFGDIHFCVSRGGARCIEWQGKEVASGRKPFEGQHDG
jgi:hypothetical protein